MILNIWVKSMNKSKLERIAIVVFLIILIAICLYFHFEKENIITNNKISYEISNIPEYNGEEYVLINNNIPKLSEEDMKIESYYSKLNNGRVRNGYDKNKLGKSKRR